MTAAEQALVEANLGLVRLLASKLCRGDEHLFDDLCQEGSIGLIQAAQKYDGRVEFGAWARIRIHGAMVDYLRSEMRPVQDEWTVELEETVPAAVIDMEGDLEMLNALAKLPTREAEVALRLICGYSQRQVASDFGVDENKIRRLVDKAAKRLLAA